MTTQAVPVAAQAGLPGRYPRLLRALTAALYAVMLLVIGLIGIRQSTYDDLTSALRDGDVTQVTVARSFDDQPGARGERLARLEWREYGLVRVAEVRQTVPQDAAEVGRSGEPVIVGRIDEQLRSIDPNVVVTHVPDGPSARSFVSGWELPDWGAPLTLLLLTVFCGALSVGPEPRGGTRWAWFWVTLSPLVLVTIPAYLIVGRRGAIPGARRLTGGWAFLASLLLLPSLLGA